MSIPARKLATSTTSRYSRRQSLPMNGSKENDPEGVAFVYEVTEE
jgi:hypothetical protein